MDAMTTAELKIAYMVCCLITAGSTFVLGVSVN